MPPFRTMRQKIATSVAVEKYPPAGQGVRFRSVRGYVNCEIVVSSRSFLAAFGLYDLARRLIWDLLGQKVVSFIPKGLNRRASMKSSYDIPLTTSTMRPAVLTPALL